MDHRSTAGRFAGSQQRGSRRGIGALALLLACLAFAACQGPEGERRMHQFLGGKEEGPPAAPGSPIASPSGTPKQLTQGQAIQPPSDTANVPTLKNAEIYRSEGAAPAPSTPQQNPVIVSGTGEVTLNFVNADIREVIDTVLGNTLKVGFVIDPRVQGVVTLRTARPVANGAVIGVLEDVLAMNGAAIVQSNGLYKVVPVEEAVQTPAILSQGAEPIHLDQGFGLHVIPLKYTSAAALKDVIEPFIPPGRILRVDAQRNLIVFVGTGQEATDVEDLIATFDVDWMANMSFALLPVRFADPEAMVGELEKIFTQENAATPVVQFVPIKRLNGILVISPQAAYLDKARVWVARLDRGQEGDKRKLYVYYVQNGRASELADVLGQAFGVSATTAAQPEQAQLAPGLSGTEIGGGGGGSSLSSGGYSPGLGGASSTGALGQSLTGGQSAFGNTSGAGESLRRAPAATTGPTSLGATTTAGAPGGAANGLRIVADARNNALVVYATANEYEAIEAALQKLDIVPLQVLIEATIAEVTLNDALKYGVEWYFKAGNNAVTFNTKGSSLAAPTAGLLSEVFPGFSYLFASDNVKVVINALSTVSNVKVISSPSLLVLDNEAARLQVGDQVPIVVRSEQSVDTSGAPVIDEVEYRDTGVILDIIPHVNASGLVVLDIVQEVSDVATTTSSAINSPTIQQRRIASTVAVNGGETIALGGLIRDSTDNEVNGIPVLSDIPILGNLFKTTGDTVKRTELLVLLTPHVIRDRNDARTVTDELRRRLRALPPLSSKIQ
jgi:general secretion pathway protein D